MPIRHDKKGWYWGSKGPFDTKAQALAVARAAYAHGYKEQIMDNTTVAKFISALFHAVTKTHIMHLQTRSFAQHMALGDFYEGVVDLADALAEAIQGRYGLIEGYDMNAGELPASPVEYLIGLSEYVEEARADMPQDTEIQNMIDEIASLIDSTLYKLRFLG